MEGHDPWRRRGCRDRGRKKRGQDARLCQIARETIEKKPIGGRHIRRGETMLDNGQHYLRSKWGNTVTHSQ